MQKSALILLLLVALIAPLAWGQDDPDFADDQTQDSEAWDDESSEAAEAEFDDDAAAVDSDQEDAASADSDPFENDDHDLEQTLEPEDLDTTASDAADGQNEESSTQDEPSEAVEDEEFEDEPDAAAELGDEDGDAIAADEDVTFTDNEDLEDDSAGTDDRTEADDLSGPDEARDATPAPTASDASTPADPLPPASPPPPTTLPAGTKLYVGNLPFSATEDELRSLFSEYGAVEDVTIITDRETRRPRGFGYVTFSNAEGANEAIQALNDSTMGGRVLKVNLSGPPTPRPGRDRSW